MQDSQVGNKRKRYTAPLEDIGTKITKKLHHHLKEVRKAAKKAKDFETRKLIKKLNELRRNDSAPETIEDYESQLRALKDIEHDEIGNTAMKTKCMKDHILSANEHFTTALAKEIPTKLVTVAPSGTSGSKVQSRLLSSKLLAQEVSISVENICNIIQPQNVLEEDAVVGEDNVENGRQTKKMKTRNDAGNMDVEAATRVVKMQDLHNGEDDTEPVDETGWESGTVGDDEKERDDGWESGSVDHEQLTSHEEDETESLGMNSDDGSPPPRLSAATSKTRKASSSAAQSTFLPSLSVGFIRGSDDSDFSEGEANIADNTVKKNRRGQRARRAIWEKKYGRNANHKKKEIAEKTEIAKQKAERRRERGESDIKGRRGFKKSFDVGQQSQDSGWKGRNPDSQKAESLEPKSKRADDKPLHPSWEAKRKLKAKDFGGIVPSQGQKIKFS